ncbi:CRISPR-associated helicase Cas3' [Bifidobacterium aquikefiricola]|uniref:CRISPR-associated helicase Cas3 n=1 Tax=Bifidobacterium aquikefiricola TaxID=3059038 RepID=A0AB39U4N8_9BIFI
MTDLAFVDALKSLNSDFTQLWGKKDIDASGHCSWLPLVQHMVDTSNVMGLLWEHWLSGEQQQLLTHAVGNADKAKNIALFLGAVHDIGKATPVFQTKKSYQQSDELDSQIIEKLVRSGFEDLDNLYLADMNKAPHALAGACVLHNSNIPESLVLLVSGHHGKPADSLHSITELESNYRKHLYQSQDSGSAIAKRWQSVQRELLHFDLSLSGLNIADLNDVVLTELPSQVIYEGLLIMADWLASNTIYFPLQSIDSDFQDSEGFQNDRLEHAWQKISGDIQSLDLDWPGDYIPAESIIHKRFGFEARQVQTEILQRIEQTSEAGIYIIEAPMGIGKTEIALSAAEILSHKFKTNGMFFGLPTMSTADGIFKRIETWLEKTDPYDTKSLRLIHSKSQFNEDFEKLQDASQVDIDGEPENGTVAVNSWFSGAKLRILDDFIVATVDHFLLAALKQKHLALRHLGLSKKVIVIDEVHAYDAYMGQYLYRAVQWMGSYGVPIIILSATLPAARRKQLVESYFRGTDRKWRNRTALVPNWEESNAYPLLTYTDGEEINQISQFETIPNHKVRVKHIDEAAIHKLLQEQLSEGGVAGIIVNTVKKAQELYESLKRDCEVELIHSSFLAPHRAEKERAILQQIGKDSSNRPSKKVFIGTQVLEQSLDIDFDVLITYLAPMDLLLQRVGRLHRHNRPRPEKLRDARVYVAGINADGTFDEGTSFIYGDYLLMRTQHFLPTVLNLPSDISPLVQMVYSEKDEDQLNSDRYRQAKAESKSLMKTKEEKAGTWELQTPQGSLETTLVGWLNNPSTNTDEEHGVAQVRDAEDSIEVILLRRTAQGIQLLDTDEIITEAWLKKPANAKKLAQQTIRLPKIFSRLWSIDSVITELERLNKENLAFWQQIPLLKGSLGLILDEHNKTELHGYILEYSKSLGLQFEKEDSNA